MPSTTPVSTGVGILRVFDLDEIFDAVETLATKPRVAGDRLWPSSSMAAVVGYWRRTRWSGRAASSHLSPDADTLAKLNAVLPPTWSHGNPIDIIGDANGARYSAALEALIGSPDTDAVLVLNCPTAIASGIEAAQSVSRCRRRN